MLTTPETIRTFQRKLYTKAKSKLVDTTSLMGASAISSIACVVRSNAAHASA